MPKSRRPRRNRQYRRRKYAKKTRSDAQVKRLAAQVVGSQKIMKRFPNDATNSSPNLSTYNGNPWLLFQPTNIDGVGDSGTQADILRQTNEAWINRMSGILHIQFSKLTVNMVEIRKLCGWYKGSTNAADPGITGLTAHHLKTSFPDRIQRYDPDNWKILHDKTFSVCPHSIYDSSGSDNSAGTEPMRAIWKPVTLKCNMKLNKVFRWTDYDDAGHGTGTADGLVSQGSLLAGSWYPFIAVQIRCPDQDFTAVSGSNPSPVLDYKFTTYFKDNH